MAKYFSLRLALNNLKNNRKFYLPYLFAAVGIIAMFYIMCFLAFNTGTKELSNSLSYLMGMGCVIIGIFSFIFLFYINSFIMKRRKKEIGLYNILGMDKRHISGIMALENLLVSSASIIFGILCGVLFSKLIHMIMCWVLGFKQPIGFEISWKGIVISAIIFAGMFLLTMIVNQMSIQMSKPIELLYGSNVGEKEPKTKIIMTVLGVICIGIGYYMAITLETSWEAIMFFFPAVVLVIAGTYCLFTAGSIAVLKSLRKNKKLYYKPSNFTAVSGMIYRMKQNAVGLASICILSTMVLVMVSGTVSLYMGMKDIIDTNYAHDINVTLTENNESSISRNNTHDIIERAVNEEGQKVEGSFSLRFVNFIALKEGNDFVLPELPPNYSSESSIISVLTAEEYNRYSGEKINLEKNQVMNYSSEGELADTFKIGDMTFERKGYLDSRINIANSSIYSMDYHCIVVADDDVMKQLTDMQRLAYGEYASNVKYEFYIDITGTDDEKKACFAAVRDAVTDSAEAEYSVESYSRQEQTDSYYEIVGGFLFLGVFLGIVFTCAAALIIYYKQISEGYYDKDKFEIMQKVGMNKKEVKKSIKKQVLMVFFLPLIMAGIHVAAAFNLITQLLTGFSMYNTGLFTMCTIITFLIFAVIYALVYAVTAREYYKIVG